MNRNLISLFVVMFCLAGVWGLTGWKKAAQPIRISVFKANVTPPIGSPVAYANTVRILNKLSAKGVIIHSDQEPIVLVAVDWIGISNDCLDELKAKIAEAAQTRVARVSVHVLHQHDGPTCSFVTEAIMAKYGMGGKKMDLKFLNKSIHKIAKAVRKAFKRQTEITHLGFGRAKVEKVASNRRILGEDGKVAMMRFSKCTDSLTIAAPEGLIDPWLKSVSFWNQDKPIAVMTFYATHPQSYYGDGEVTCEFVGIARNQREKSLKIPHIHFNGAGGNIAAGKYNDGSKERRPVLTKRMETGMRKAWEATEKFPVSVEDISWRFTEMTLPPGAHLVEEDLITTLTSDTMDLTRKFTAADQLAWLRRTEAGHPVEVSALGINKFKMLNVPGELFIEYQLFAQGLRPGDYVCTAAYEEYGMGYIGTTVAYGQGGYETSERASKVAPEVEPIVKAAIQEVLK